MGVGVQGGVLAGLHRDLGQGGCGCAGVLHVAAGAEGIAGHHVIAADVALRGVLGGHGHGSARHLLGTEGEGHVVDAGGDAPVGLPEGGGAAGAGVLDVDDGDAGEAELGQSGLAEGHAVVVDVAEVGDGDVSPADAGVLQGLDDSVEGEVAEVLFREAAEGVEADAGHHDFTSGTKLSHVLYLRRDYHSTWGHRIPAFAGMADAFCATLMY